MCECLPRVLQAFTGDIQLWPVVLPERTTQALLMASFFVSVVTWFEIPLVWFWHAALSHRGPCRTYRAIQVLRWAKWVLSSAWRLNVMALSPGSRVFHPLISTLIRAAPPRSSSISALLNYAFSWLEYRRRMCHFWMFTFNKTDPVSPVI